MRAYVLPLQIKKMEMVTWNMGKMTTEEAEHLLFRGISSHACTFFKIQLLIPEKTRKCSFDVNHEQGHEKGEASG